MKNVKQGYLQKRGPWNVRMTGETTFSIADASTGQQGPKGHRVIVLRYYLFPYLTHPITHLKNASPFPFT